ncbi:REL [Cordylochernes scorpioides]|uniref:REL n=1 Tax=Cordylochernes scorpioides TaxID=51811 RepID=A0ABY6LK98_9ARAC|nr:REL [Cordylochernes scorpioides]
MEWNWESPCPLIAILPPEEVILREQRSPVEQHKPCVRIVEQPADRHLRFRYKCEGRSAGSLVGQHSTASNKTFPTIQILNHRGPAVVVVSCVTKDPPYRPHPHNLVGKSCKKGVFTAMLSPAESQDMTFRHFEEICGNKQKFLRVTSYDHFGLEQIIGNIRSPLSQLLLSLIIEDDPRSGRPSTLMIEHTIQQNNNYNLYNPQTKKQSLEWLTLNSLWKKKVRLNQSKGKVMLIIILYFLTTKEFYIMKIQYRGKGTSSFSQQWKLLHDNSHAHKAPMVMDYLAEHSVAVLSHPPFSSDLSPGIYFIFLSSNLHRVRQKICKRKETLIWDLVVHSGCVHTKSDVCSFNGLGIQCVKKNDIEESLTERQLLKVDPFQTGFSHMSQPGSIDLNAVRLAIQVFIQGSHQNKFSVPLSPLVTDPIYDKKTFIADGPWQPGGGSPPPQWSQRPDQSGVKATEYE